MTVMSERRAAPRHRIDEQGLIAIDEHTSMPCLIYDLSERGARLVAPEAPKIPGVFLLAADRFSDPQVCEVVWRTPEEIGARFMTNA